MSRQFANPQDTHTHRRANKVRGPEGDHQPSVYFKEGEEDGENTPKGEGGISLSLTHSDLQSCVHIHTDRVNTQLKQAEVHTWHLNTSRVIGFNLSAHI